MTTELIYRKSHLDDGTHLKSWLLAPGILKWFPICNEREVDDAVHFWLSYIRFGCAITIEQNKEPIGMCTLYLPFLEKIKHQCLFVICVTPKARNQGIGSALLTYMMEMAKRDYHIEILQLEVYEGNPALRLYERLGFEVIGTHPNFLKEEDGNYRTKIFMQKRL
jgi:putative acetyltransferase